MRARLVRSLVNALGERGELSLPVVPQLLPVVSISDLKGIGFPLGWPVNFQCATAAVAAARSVAQVHAPSGFVVRIDRIRNIGGAYSIHIGFNTTQRGDPPIAPWVIVDGRGGNGSLCGILKSIWQGNQAIADIQTLEAASQQWKIASAVPDGTWFEGPFYVTDMFQVLIFADTDNQASRFQGVGEAFEVG